MEAVGSDRLVNEQTLRTKIHVPKPLYKEEGICNVSHLASLFQVPEPIQGVKLKIFPRSKAYMGRARHFSKSQSLYGGARKFYDVIRRWGCENFEICICKDREQSHETCQYFEHGPEKALENEYIENTIKFSWVSKANNSQTQKIITLTIYQT